MPGRPEDSETFVRFIQTAREDPGFAALLKNAGLLPPERRNILLEQMAAKMALRGERPELIQVVHWLLDDALFQRVLEMIDKPLP